MAQKETIANLEAKLAQARRLLQGVSDQTTTKRIQGFIADWENRIRNSEAATIVARNSKVIAKPAGW